MKKLLSYLFALAAVAFAFTSCEDVPMPYDYPTSNGGGSGETTEVEPSGTGTAADPYNVAGVLKAIKDLGEGEYTPVVYVKGKIKSIKSVETAQYGNASYFITDNGSNEVYIFQSYYLGNVKFTAEDQIKVDDEVIVCGRFYNYNGNTPETEGKGKSYIYSLNGKTAEGGGDTPSGEKGQSKENPYTVKEAVDLINSGKAGSTEVYVKGIVSSVDYFNSKYKSLSYYLSDDGKSKDLDIYSGKGLNGADFSGKSDLKVGQTVIVKGKLELFTDKSGNKIPEVSQSSEIVSIEGSGETPSTGDKGLSKDNPLTPSEALDIATALGKGNTSTESYYIKGKISSIKFSFDAEYGTATFNISADGSKSGEFTCYSVYYFGNKSWVEGNMQVKEGDEVVVYGKLTNFKGTSETAAKKACLYSLNGKTE